MSERSVTMNNILPIGSVVRLNGGTQKIMITNRGSLFNNGGTIGYFDYSACLYPYGQANQNVHFFNEEDIAEVYFEGYKDESETTFCEEYQNKIKHVSYPKFKLGE